VRMAEKQRDTRQAAEAQVAERLRGRFLVGRVFARVLRAVRTMVATRENLRLLRSRAFGMVRRIFRALGRALVTSGRLELMDDIFYLSVEEVTAEVRGQALTRDLRALVALRRREFDEFAARAPPARIHVYGLAYAAPFAAPVTAGAPVSELSESGGDLRGIGCVRGRVRGRARIILDPAQQAVASDEILVAQMTDPGWVFLMVAARGIVVERGSLLSHTAIVARELGIPTIVGVPDATRRISNGQELEVDGGEGVVRVVGAD
ncbi:PEP-utilizing enzyme, partial [Planctomycetota bacterium]